MPSRPPRSCRVCGVPLNGKADCPQHPRAKVETRDSRPSAAKRGYGRKWQEYRKVFFSVPRICACGCAQPCTIDNGDIDHIIAVRGPKDPLFWKHSNHQAMLHGHHSRKTATIDRARPGRGDAKL